MATYYALSTENAQTNGWSILAIADTRDEARGLGEDALPQGHDIRADTWSKNLRVVSATEAARRYGLRGAALDNALHAHHSRAARLAASAEWAANLAADRAEAGLCPYDGDTRPCPHHDRA